MVTTTRSASCAAATASSIAAWDGVVPDSSTCVVAPRAASAVARVWVVVAPQPATSDVARPGGQRQQPVVVLDQRRGVVGDLLGRGEVRRPAHDPRGGGGVDEAVAEDARAAACAAGSGGPTGRAAAWLISPLRTAASTASYAVSICARDEQLVGAGEDGPHGRHVRAGTSPSRRAMSSASVTMSPSKPSSSRSSPVRIWLRHRRRHARVDRRQHHVRGHDRVDAGGDRGAERRQVDRLAAAPGCGSPPAGRSGCRRRCRRGPGSAWRPPRRRRRGSRGPGRRPVSDTSAGSDPNDRIPITGLFGLTLTSETGA